MEQLQVKAFGFELSAEQNLFHLSLADLEAFPVRLPLYSPRFTLFLACDGRQVPVKVLAALAGKAFAAGAVYVCCWGPGCERVHDIFDEVVVERGPGSNVMTTWHEDETLEDALDFFLTLTKPQDDLTADCRAALAVSISNKDWASRIDRFLLSQVADGARTYIYDGAANGQMWMRDDFNEPMEEFAEYI